VKSPSQKVRLTGRLDFWMQMQNPLDRTCKSYQWGAALHKSSPYCKVGFAASLAVSLWLTGKRHRY
jgi:hypothetical protein